MNVFETKDIARTSRLARQLGGRVTRKLTRVFGLGRPPAQPLPLLDQVGFARAITSGPAHHFFGYYDKCPWDKTGRYVLAHEVDFGERMPHPDEAVRVGIIDTHENDKFIVLDQTRAWCWQQGSMLQWLGTAPERKIVYNTFDGRAYRAVVRDVLSGDVRLLPHPVYAVSPGGHAAVSIDFDHLHRCQVGYGYVADSHSSEFVPALLSGSIVWMDMSSGESRQIVSLEWAAANRVDERFFGADHWFCPLQFSPSGERVLFLHRWAQPGGRRWTRLYVTRPDGTDTRLLCDNGMFSHFDWRDNETILAWSDTKFREPRFQLFDTRTGHSQVVGEGVLTEDGHCSYSPDRRWILNDTYPDGERYQALMLYHVASGRRFDLMRCHAPITYDGACRCDLHPRWDRTGRMICFDSIHSGRRQIYVADVSKLIDSVQEMPQAGAAPGG